MYRTITFYVGKKTIVLGEQSFMLGQLTAEILNISPEEHQTMMQILSQAMEEMKQYRETKDTSHWGCANQHLLELDRKLCAYQLFRLLKEDPCVLQETESLLNTLAQETLDGFDIAEEEETAQPEAMEYHWAAYVENYKTYRSILTNLASFNQTIRFFIQHYLSTLRKMDSENYAAALYEYLNDPRAAQKIIAGPFSGGGLYSNADPVLLRFVPRRIDPEVDKY